MPYVNVGCYINNVRPKSKKAIKEALKEIAEGTRGTDSVKFDVTQAFGPDAGKVLYAYVVENGAYPDGLSKGVSYQVCGPDPYTNRKFYGTVKVNNQGTIVCS
jgi:hypothetical protein